MVDYNFDFYMHAMMLIYQDAVHARIAQNGQELPQESDSGMDNDWDHRNEEGMGAEGVEMD